MLVCCAHKELASNPSYSDDKCASRSSHVTVAQSGPCPSADVRTAQLGQLYVRAAAHAGCKCAGSGQVGQRTAAAAWISRAGVTVPRCLCAPFGTSTVAPPDKLHVVLLEPHSRSTKASRDAGLVFLNTNLTRKGCTCDTAAAVRCPTWPLPAHLHPACAAARSYS
jgi:hypothetical protein